MPADASLAQELNTLVVGAGPAGLAVAACLGRAGVEHRVVDAADSVGSAWRTHYKRLHLHTVKRHSALPFTPWPANTPTYPSRQQVVDYLEAYAREHRIQPHLGVRVQQMVRRGDRWIVTTSAGEVRARSVVMACGYNGVPFTPPFPGLDEVGVPVCHTSAYSDGAPFKGQQVLVVGCGNSGAEIVLDLAEHGAHPMMVVRGPVHVLPRDLFGRPSQETGIALSFLPVRVRDAMTTALLRVAVGDLSRFGIIRPREGPIAMIEKYGRVPILDIGTIAAVKAGRVTVVPGVTRFGPRRVFLADGTDRPVDAVVMATGFRTGLERYFPEGVDLDARGRPRGFGQETAPGLYFVGFRNPPTGALREMALEAPRVAAALRRRAA